MRLKGIWILFAIALGGLALAAAGCGGDDDSATTTAAESAIETTETTATESEEMMTEETETTGTETEAMEEDETETGTGDLSFATSENCQEFAALASSFATAMSGSGSDTEEAADALREFADQAPEEIREDFQTLADAYGTIADALEGYDPSSGQAPTADQLAKLQQIGTEIDTAEVTAASANISAWTTENCTGG